MPTIEAQKGINTYLREEMTKLLRENDIYEFGAHGWKNADEHDPDYLGHAMWQTDGPTDVIFEIQMGPPKVISPEIPAWHKLASIAGADFEGLLIAARLSIGLALFQYKMAEERTFCEDNFFHVHVMSAVVALSAASDRLRDLLIAAAFRKARKAYESGSFNGHRRSMYETPFLEAIENCRDYAVVHQPLAVLHAQSADNIHFRDSRNVIVHEIATELGRQRKSMIDDIPHMGENVFDYEAFGDTGLQEMFEKTQAEYDRKITQSLDLPMKWYRLLIEMSNNVFIVENRLRNRTA